MMRLRLKSMLLTVSTATAFGLLPTAGFSANLPYPQMIEKAEEIVASVEADQQLAERVPDEYKDGLNVGMTFRFPPLRWIYEGTRLGPEYDLARAIGKLLDTNIDFVDVSFDSIIPSIRARRIDMAVISMADRKVPVKAR